LFVFENERDFCKKLDKFYEKFKYVRKVKRKSESFLIKTFLFIGDFYMLTQKYPEALKQYQENSQDQSCVFSSFI